jgi:hypothetical protein
LYQTFERWRAASPITVMRGWTTAKAWLYRELAGNHTDLPSGTASIST